MIRLLFTLYALLLILGFCNVASAAEVLVKWNSQTTYEIGDIVVVQEDGFNWGTGEDPRKGPIEHFVLVLIPGVPASEIMSYLESEIDNTDPENPVLVRKRRWKADTVKITNPIKNQLNNSGYVTITKNQWDSFVTDKAAP